MKLIGSNPLWLAVSGLGIQAGLIGLQIIGDLAAFAAEAIPLLLATSIFYLISCFIVLQKEIGGRAIRWTILTFALSSRLILAPALPSLSEDLYRYRWEGRVQLAGGHPYTAAPEEERWLGLRDETYTRVAGKDIRFGYGPLWCLVERGTARVAEWAGGDAWRQVLWFKLPAALADLALIWVLGWVLGLYGLPWQRVVIYAWCPLVVVEFWHSGHNDALVALFIVAAVGLMRKGRAGWAGAMVGLAAMVKIWPVFLVVLLALGARSWRPAWGAALASVGFVSYLRPLWERADFVTGFLGGWRNNDSLFGVILWAAGGDGQRAKWASLALIVAWAVVVGWRRMEHAQAMLWFVVGMLLVSANVHPWYLTWFVPLLALRPSVALLAWVCLMPVCYGVLAVYAATGRWVGTGPWRWYVYGPAALVWLLERRIGRGGTVERSATDGDARKDPGLV